VELSKEPLHEPEAFVSHANALLTPRARLRLAKLVVQDGWTYSMAAKMFTVSPRTAAKWANRYRAEGIAGMADRSSRPHRSPTKTPESLKRQIVRLRWRHRLGRCRSPAGSACRPRPCTQC
jgi:transposase-like protein